MHGPEISTTQSVVEEEISLDEIEDEPVEIKIGKIEKPAFYESDDNYRVFDLDPTYHEVPQEPLPSS